MALKTPATPDDLFARLVELNIETVTHHHAPLHSVAESQELRGELPGGHCKNLFLKDKKGVLWLVVTLEDRQVDMKTLSGTIASARLSFGKPELMIEVLGIEPGSVTPFALINDPDHQVRVVLDAEMMDMELLNYHPLSNRMTTRISASDLLIFIAACGHTPVTVKL
ncbi:MAG: prolyl-tRNA synthetase associated domain-containing protein [Rhodospirillaceae bacterium]|jgi:Ala-tRNA(Pro) deacylase|nr:prolyl-tRNA synthetase associated domain-containing protein [Rhodospirillales bacterium]MBT3905161.1 prolyl-tRNA synthetase associated domain-containing protein [Rhodospirillaceae bacterium]MBT4702543.1 prolyl-tRNA synthetase associated domain-containing protein [Rhodospirillaceae bacterium]MBT5034862.1 prolyl-tRNA synthetase associated domain-containing protein [Rhodospirillaceae bacterium]MBT6219669.1 prolyl-tRNA synthetase associated domain-containing protein [Rhodospirillaceae bacterium]